jgi:hypothetical protein
MRFVGQAAATGLLLIFLTGLSAPAQAGHCCADRNVYQVDPYAYHYEQRGYYPHYQSGYWRRLKEVRKTYRRRIGSQESYRYLPSWGNPWGRHRQPRERFWPWHY